MTIEEAIRICRTIGECEVGTIRKVAISTLIDEVLKKCKENVKGIDNQKKT